MTYNMTDEDWEKLSDEQVLELSDANIKFGRRLDVEMVRRGLVTAGPEENARVAHLERQLAERDAEIARLRREGVPGVMHEVDKGFYNLAISERDFARTQVANRDAEIAQLRYCLARVTDQETGS